MKKFQIIILLFLFIFIFNACADNIGNDITSSENTSSVEVINQSSDYSFPLSSEWKSQNGTYLLTTNSTNGKLINFLDNNLLNITVLCNKPDCMHTDENCNAYIPDMDCIERIKEIVKYDYQALIFQIENKLYVIDIFGSVISMNPDGTEHQNILNIDSKYTIDKCYIYNNKIYAHATYLPPYDKSIDSDFTDEDHNIALLEIDLQNKTVTELYSFKNELDTTLLGLYDGKAYYFYCSPSEELSSYTQAAFDAEENGHDVKLYYYDIETKTRTYIKNDLKSIDLDNVILVEDSIFYHCRSEKQLIKIDLTTGKDETVLKNLDGYIEFPYTYPVYDNKLLLIKLNSRSHLYSSENIEDETLYMDLTTYETGNIEYRYNISDGSTTNLYEIFAETDKYYVLLSSVSEEGKDSYVIVQKDDFWNNNFDNIESLNWD